MGPEEDEHFAIPESLIRTIIARPAPPRDMIPRRGQDLTPRAYRTLRQPGFAASHSFGSPIKLPRGKDPNSSISGSLSPRSRRRGDPLPDYNTLSGQPSTSSESVVPVLGLKSLWGTEHDDPRLQARKLLGNWKKKTTRKKQDFLKKFESTAAFFTKDPERVTTSDLTDFMQFVKADVTGHKRHVDETMKELVAGVKLQMHEQGEALAEVVDAISERQRIIIRAFDVSCTGAHNLLERESTLQGMVDSLKFRLRKSEETNALLDRELLDKHTELMETRKESDERMKRFESYLNRERGPKRAALAIQRMWRGRWPIIKLRRDHLFMSATKIQKVYRGAMTRLRYIPLLVMFRPRFHASILLAEKVREWYVHRQARLARKLAFHQERCSVIIQCWFRIFSATRVRQRLEVIRRHRVELEQIQEKLFGVAKQIQALEASMTDKAIDKTGRDFKFNNKNHNYETIMQNLGFVKSKLEELDVFAKLKQDAKMSTARRMSMLRTPPSRGKPGSATSAKPGSASSDKRATSSDKRATSSKRGRRSSVMDPTASSIIKSKPSTAEDLVQQAAQRFLSSRGQTPQGKHQGSLDAMAQEFGFAGHVEAHPNTKDIDDKLRGLREWFESDKPELKLENAINKVEWLHELDCQSLARRITLYDRITKPSLEPVWLDRFAPEIFKELCMTISGETRSHIHVRLQWTRAFVNCPLPALGYLPEMRMSEQWQSLVANGRYFQLAQEWFPSGLVCMDPAATMHRHLLTHKGLPEMADQTLANIATAVTACSQSNPEGRVFRLLFRFRTNAPGLPFVVYLRAMIAELGMVFRRQDVVKTSRMQPDLDSQSGTAASIRLEPEVMGNPSDQSAGGDELVLYGSSGNSEGAQSTIDAVNNHQTRPPSIDVGMLPDILREREHLSVLNAFIILIVLFRLDADAAESEIDNVLNPPEGGAPPSMHSFAFGALAVRILESEDLIQIPPGVSLIKVAARISASFSAGSRRDPQVGPILKTIDRLGKSETFQHLHNILIPTASFTEICLLAHEEQSLRLQHAYWATEAYSQLAGRKAWIALSEFELAVSKMVDSTLIPAFEPRKVFEQVIIDNQVRNMNFELFSEVTYSLFQTSTRPLLALLGIVYSLDDRADDNFQFDDSDPTTDSDTIPSEQIQANDI